jgi:lysozyme
MINDQEIVDSAIIQIVKDEGFRPKPYKDTVGVWTIGHGLTYLTPEESRLIVSVRIHDTYLPAARRLFPNFDDLTEKRRKVLINMCFNLGETRLKMFVRFRKRVLAEDYNLAADEMLDSKWARQVGHRAQRLAREMRIG